MPVAYLAKPKEKIIQEFKTGHTVSGLDCKESGYRPPNSGQIHHVGLERRNGGGRSTKRGDTMSEFQASSGRVQ
jgi:hypothetical protein